MSRSAEVRQPDVVLDYQEIASPLAEPTMPAPAARARPVAIRRYAPVILALIDLALVYLAFMVAYWVRYDLQLGPAIQARDQLGFQAYLPLVVPLVVFMLTTLWAKGAYRMRMGNEMQDDITSTLSAATITVATIVVLTAMLHQYQYSRGVIIYLWLALIVLLVLGRWVYRLVMAALFRRGIGVRRLLIVGATETGKMIMQGVAGRRDLGYELVGFVHTRAETPPGTLRQSAASADFGRFRNLGFAADVPSIVDQERIDEVIIALPASAHQDILPILQHCEAGGIGFKIVPDTFELSLGRVQVDDLAGIPVLDVREQPLHRLKLAVKQGTDVVLAFALGIVFLPVLLLTALAIRLDSAGPIIIIQERVGQNGRLFRCYKFRSMCRGSEEMLSEMHPFNEADGPLYKSRNDPRRTRVGRFIRRHSIDEMPQLWNVVRREMSLVGPRPALPHEVTEYEPWQRRRLQSRPGITGMWQVSGRSDLSFDEMVMLDIYYIENWSLILDLKILLRTVAAMITGRGAY